MALKQAAQCFHGYVVLLVYVYKCSKRDVLSCITDRLLLILAHGMLQGNTSYFP